MKGTRVSCVYYQQNCPYKESLETYLMSLGEMVDFVESDKLIKIRAKVYKSNTYDGFSNNISFFIQRRTSSD